MDELNSIKVATEWWVNKLKNPGVSDIGDYSIMSKKMMMLQFMLASGSSKNISEEQLESFKETLEELITNDIQNYDKSILSVDYQSEGTLSKAVISSNISEDVFPLKTTMHVTRDEVLVSEGYCNEFKTIYPVKVKRI